jgi:hypothetical protein
MKQIGLIGPAAQARPPRCCSSRSRPARRCRFCSPTSPSFRSCSRRSAGRISPACRALIASAALARHAGSVAFAFLLGIGLPAWWIGYLALLARRSRRDPPSIEWYPVGRIVVWTAIAARVSCSSRCCATASMPRRCRPGCAANWTRAALSRRLPAIAAAASSVGSDALLDVLVLIVPPMKAIALTATSLLNLWLAALIVRVSGG